MNHSVYSRLETALGSDQMEITGGRLVVRPKEIPVLADAMRIISAEGGSVVILGGGTAPAASISGDQIPISLNGLAGVREVNPGDFLLTAGAGTTADAAVEAARQEQLLLPLDITSGSRATLGGVYMTDAVSPWSAGYGPFRDYVLGARCVTARGEVITIGGRTMKNVTGYEITRFLAGTRGMFAIAAELILKTIPLPERQVMVVGTFDRSGNPFEASAKIETAGNAVKRCEIIAMEGCGRTVRLGVGIEGMEPMVQKGAGLAREIMERAGAVAVTEESPESFTALRRDAAHRLTGAGMTTLRVPPSAASAVLDRLRSMYPELPVLAHPRLGRIHVAAKDQDVRPLAELSLAVGGKIPADWACVLHEGLEGLFTASELAVARALKRELDPEGVLNPHLKLG